MAEHENLQDGADTSPALASMAGFNLSERDKQMLSITDEEFKPHSFSNLQELTRTNALDQLTRYPTQLRNYIIWTAETKAKWGTMNNYLLHNRLHWEPLPSDSDPPVMAFKLENETPLRDPRDFKILPNDWPYGLSPGLTHVVVWLKHKFEVDDVRGDLTPESREMVERFVRANFGGAEKVVWWRNWTALQSVRGLDHVHVVVKGMTPTDVLELTGEDGIDIPGKAPVIAARTT